jgi:hypothetical protein
LNTRTLILFLLGVWALGCGTNLTEDYTILVLPESIDLVSGTLNDTNEDGSSNDDTTLDFPIRVFVTNELEATVNDYELTVSSPGAFGQLFADSDGDGVTDDVDFIQFLQSDGSTLCSSPCSMTTDAQGKIDLFLRVNHVDRVTDTAAFEVLFSNQTLVKNLTVSISFE